MAITTFSGMISTVRMELRYSFLSSSELILMMKVEAMREIKPAYRWDQHIYAYADCRTHGCENWIQVFVAGLYKIHIELSSYLEVALVESGRVILLGRCTSVRLPKGLQQGPAGEEWARAYQHPSSRFRNVSLSFSDFPKGSRL